MLIDRHRKKIKRYFRWEKYIAEEVEITRREQEARRHSRNPVGIDDPTGGFVVRKNMPLKRIVIFVKGKRIVITKPEAWMQVIRDTYELYSRQPIANLVREHIENPDKTIDILSGFMGISPETYKRWETEFFDDAVFLAGVAGLYPKKNS